MKIFVLKVLFFLEFNFFVALKLKAYFYYELVKENGYLKL